MAINKSLNVAIVGFGYWGPKLLRNFKNSNKFKVKYLVDIDLKVVEDFQFSNPEVVVADTLDEVLSDASLDCVVIATPPKTHFELGKRALSAKKHVLIEKPFCTSFAEANALVELADEMDCKIMVDYTFLYNGTVKCVKQEIGKPAFGDVLYIDSVRINLGIFQNDVNVVMDLACHDVSIFNYLLDELPQTVQAIGIDGLNNGIENIAYIHLKYKNKFAHINCSWSSPVKIRTMLLGGSKRAVLYNDIEPTDKVKVYDKGVGFSPNGQREALLQDYRIGEVNIPKYDITEAIQNVVNEFYSLVVEDQATASSGREAIIVMFILEAIQKSIHLNGKEIKLNWEEVGPSLYSYITNKGILNVPS